MIKLSEIINSSLDDNTDSLTVMFGLSRERSEDIVEIVISAFAICPKVTETISFIEKNYTFQSQQEVFFALFVLSVEIGKLHAERHVKEFGIKSAIMGRFQHIRDSVKRLKKRGIELPESFDENMQQETSNFVGSLLKEILGDSDTDDVKIRSADNEDGPFTNKNKFKKGKGFDLNDLNKKDPPDPDTKGENPTEEKT